MMGAYNEYEVLTQSSRDKLDELKVSPIIGSLVRNMVALGFTVREAEGILMNEVSTHSAVIRTKRASDRRKSER